MRRVPRHGARVPQGRALPRRRLRQARRHRAVFAGYKGLRGADFVWDERTLDAWLADPRGLLDGKNTAMTLRLNDAGQRADVIAYLKTLRQ